MRNRRLRATLLALVGVAGLSACADDYGYGGYGYSGVSVGYGTRGCDPYYYDCGYGGAYGYGGYADPWYGWWGNYYYPGIGFYIYDRGGNRYQWNDQYRRYWEGRRGAWGQRNWNDQRWQRWDGYRGSTGTGTWQHHGTGTGTGTWNGGSWHGGSWHGGTGTGTGHWNGGGWQHGGGHRGH